VTVKLVRMRAKLKAIKQELRHRMHQSIPVQGKWLGQVVKGYFNFHAVPTNSRALGMFRHRVTKLWRRVLQHRSHEAEMTWDRMRKLANDWLPRPRVLHPWPSERFAVRHPRWEPYARIGHVRFWCSEASCYSSG
jgi:RNA-directed DNA polymerase